MTGGPHDWIVDADVRDPLAHPLEAARRQLRRAARAWLPGGGVRAVAAAVRDTLEAIRTTADWQRARLESLESLVTALAEAATPRPWRGGDERPVLLVGTGGGGTRVLGEAALRLGIILGTRVNESFDSVEWAPLVYALLLGEAAEARQRILAQAATTHARWALADRRWGIKLPELTLVLPAFLEAFPAAQVVFLARHPVSAALRRHHVTTTPEHPVGRAVLAAAYRAAGREPGRVALDPQHIRNALAWRLQIERVLQTLATLPPGQALRLRVEDFQHAPVATAARLAAFVGVTPAGGHGLVRVDERRLAAPPRDRRAAEVMALCGPLASVLGYRD